MSGLRHHFIPEFGKIFRISRPHAVLPFSMVSDRFPDEAWCPT